MLECLPWRIKEDIVMNNLGQTSRVTRADICNTGEIWVEVEEGRQGREYLS